MVENNSQDRDSTQSVDLWNKGFLTNRLRDPSAHHCPTAFYTNFICNPSIIFSVDMQRFHVGVRRGRDVYRTIAVLIQPSAPSVAGTDAATSEI
jgi:hypothetical protein